MTSKLISGCRRIVYQNDSTRPRHSDRREHLLVTTIAVCVRHVPDTVFTRPAYADWATKTFRLCSACEPNATKRMHTRAAQRCQRYALSNTSNTAYIVRRCARRVGKSGCCDSDKNISYTRARTTFTNAYVIRVGMGVLIFVARATTIVRICSFPQFWIFVSNLHES